MAATANAAETPPGRAGTAKKDGMRYRILTTQHHNGFSSIQSSMTPYSVADATPLLTIPSAAPGRFVSTYRIDIKPVSIATPPP
ncbi:MAG: Alpha-L-fucosidase [Verrucomicrobia bacterium]|jgi:hypothetical protein|nr:MAG: Alpha-L-fucosidase [Verrucomicrobiota bacterium]